MRTGRELTKDVTQLLTQVARVELNQSLLKQILSCIDLTSLQHDDDEQIIDALVAQAITPFSKVAALCVMPHLIAYTRQQLQDQNINVATVVNFPRGDAAIPSIVDDIKSAIIAGADEIDMVIPYKDVLRSDMQSTVKLMQAARENCVDKPLKVILETGALQSLEQIYTVSCRVIECGADFIKTSTGKITHGASLEATAVMLLAIKDNREHYNVGLKVSGGIRTAENAAQYVQLAKNIMGDEWLQPTNFRIGASSLLTDVVNKIN